MKCFFLLTILLVIQLLTPSFAEELQTPPYDLQIGTPFPPFQGTTWTGDAFDLSTELHQGKYLLVDFWASWCGACLEELPTLLQALKENHSERFGVVSISLDDAGTREELARVVQEHSLDFPIVTDWQGWEGRLVNDYGVEAIPANFLLAPDGTILLRDLQGDILLSVSERIAQDPDFVFEPIRIDARVEPALPYPTAVEPDIHPDYRLTLSVDNPQVPSGDMIRLGAFITSWIATGEMTLRRATDGDIVRDKEGKPMVFSVVRTAFKEHEIERPRQSGATTDWTMTVLRQPGTIDIQITPFAYSPKLGCEITGEDLFLSFSNVYYMDERELAEEGGIIDPASVDAAERTQNLSPAVGESAS